MTKKSMLIPAGLLAAALLLAGCKGAVSREIEGFDFGSKEPTETTTSETETEAATEESTSETTEEETTSAVPSGEGEEFSCKRFRADTGHTFRDRDVRKHHTAGKSALSDLF